MKLEVLISLIILIVFTIIGVVFTIFHIYSKNKRINAGFVVESNLSLANRIKRNLWLFFACLSAAIALAALIYLIQSVT
ncbi:hypothetical protein P344_06755 [Spiroplasma mirum ATCC 29335]|uniref:Uncharacterized protein n=1 Tax=Spiroplasma mirum ATCC 29335 TaxID=838561 RepID=W0GS85_9MOLU|nr:MULTISPECIES: hypothetical protein [Spiroplasma]AHF61504.1 hypothetical protein SMM_1135 [Spiroplasma mirum ATCC 29335]AHI58649.1 hypothetical protein P344_06755 [Spiroplasma mirum ATCC 29335]AKM53542.1 hypothetical protein SATRI_v1c12040 [Spiroplasma atrichopogonis]